MANSVMKTFKSFEEALQCVRQHEEETETRYVVVKKRKGSSTFSGHKIFFEEPMKSRGSLRYDGVPFVINDSTVLECQFGKDRHKAENEKKRKISVQKLREDHSHNKLKFNVQTSMKQDCCAKITIREVVKYPKFKSCLGYTIGCMLGEMIIKPEDISYQCGNTVCSSTNAIRKVEWTGFPNTLLIHLKRYNSKHRKLFTSVALDEKLALKKGSITHGYCLQSVICHYGRSCQSGHYVTYVKADGAWISLDDEKVSTLEEINAPTIQKSVYVCIYLKGRSNEQHLSGLCENIMDIDLQPSDPKCDEVRLEIDDEVDNILSPNGTVEQESTSQSLEESSNGQKVTITNQPDFPTAEDLYTFLCTQECKESLIRMHDGKENSYFVQRYKALYRKPGGTVPLGLTFLGPVSRPENEQAEVKRIVNKLCEYVNVTETSETDKFVYVIKAMLPELTIQWYRHVYGCSTEEALEKYYES